MIGKLYCNNEISLVSGFNCNNLSKRNKTINVQFQSNFSFVAKNVRLLNFKISEYKTTYYLEETRRFKGFLYKNIIKDFPLLDNVLFAFRVGVHRCISAVIEAKLLYDAF